MTATMSNHGGVHEWDLTVSQVHKALYVIRYDLQLDVWATDGCAVV